MLRTSGRPAQPPVRMALPHLPGKASVGAIRIETCARDETRNCGEIHRELLLRPEAEVVLGRAVRRCRPTARFVRFLQPEAADANRRTYRRAPRRGRRRAALRSWLPTSCLRTTGVLDRREAGRPGCCYRPRGESRWAGGRAFAFILAGSQTGPSLSTGRRSPAASSPDACFPSTT